MSSPRPAFNWRSFLVPVLVILVAAGCALAFGPLSGRVRLSRGEVFVLVAVVGSTAIVGAKGLAALLRFVLGRVRPAWGPRPELRTRSRAWAILGCVWVVALAWSRYVEPIWISTHEERLILPGLTAPLRVVAFSDTHSDSRFDVDGRLAEAINRLEPDVLIFLGDALNAGDRAPNLRAALTAMRARYAKLAIRGNWDVWYWGDIDLFGGTGFQELHSGWHSIAAGPNRLRIGGHAFADPWSPNLVVPPPPVGDGPAIFLYHANDYVPRAAEVGVDLYLCGDTHGGQLAIPLWGALLSVGRQGRDFVRGLYHVDKMQAYVTPGIGVERSFPYRFGVRPEISVLELSPK